MARIFARGWPQQFFPIFRRFERDRRGNVAMIFAIVSIPLLFAVGMGIDYGNNARKWSQMKAAADAAALAAAAQQLLGHSDAVAATVARNMFDGQIAGMSNVVFDPANYLEVTIADHVDTANFTGLTRTATVRFNAKLDNVFAGILGQPTMSVSGVSQAKGTAPPSVNYYLMLDSSPSMGIAGTSAGINTMISNTASPSQPAGCAFACHETNPAAWEVAGNPGGVDNYTLARTLGVTLRIDLVNAAVQAVISAAQATGKAANAQYGISVNTFDVAVNPVAASTIGTVTPFSDLGSLYNQLTTNPIQQLVVYNDTNLTATNPNDGNADTNWDDSIATMNATMPDPGNGTNLPGDAPQEVLFIVTDGVEDEATSYYSRAISLMSPSMCTAIKNRHIRIAVLYTEYLPLPTNPFYVTNIAPFQPDIGPDLQSCASPGLYFEVTAGQDISAAMVALFKATLPRSYLSQ